MSNDSWKDGEICFSDVRVLQNTGRALLLKFDDDDEALWIPSSQIRHGGDLNKNSDVGDEGSIYITEWMAGEKGLI